MNVRPETITFPKENIGSKCLDISVDNDFLFRFEAKWVKSLSHVWLFVTPWTIASDSSVHGIFQARILEWGAIFFSRRSSWPRDWTWVSCVACLSHQESHKIKITLNYCKAVRKYKEANTLCIIIFMPHLYHPKNEVEVL